MGNLFTTKMLPFALFAAGGFTPDHPQAGGGLPSNQAIRHQPLDFCRHG
jgi:hypothetical protein